MKTLMQFTIRTGPLKTSIELSELSDDTYQIETKQDGEFFKAHTLHCHYTSKEDALRSFQSRVNGHISNLKKIAFNERDEKETQ